MNKLVYLLVFIVLFAACEKDDDMIDLSLSSNELTFTPADSEQIVSVASDAKWSCSWNAEWILVRQQKNSIRVIVDSNPQGEQRTDVIRIMVDGAVAAELKVIQNGAELISETNSLLVNSLGDSISISINSNVQWSIDNTVNWCIAQKKDNLLSLIVDRNYSMQDRDATIALTYGEVSNVITVTQRGCEWFDSFEMITVDGGVFFMGAQKENSNNSNYDNSAFQIESPVHEVTLNSFAIGKFEVTQAQWTAAMGTNPSHEKGDNLPVDNVSWDDVQVFITLLNEKSGLIYRLPTEAEWEYAAKGGNNTHGYKYSGNSVLGACGWYYSNSDASSHHVGEKDSNELGIFDMSGNVREWCNDWMDYYQSYSVTNPLGPTYGAMKVNRGGSWTTPAINCRNTYRHSDNTYDSAQDLGFRLVLSL